MGISPRRPPGAQPNTSKRNPASLLRILNFKPSALNPRLWGPLGEAQRLGGVWGGCYGSLTGFFFWVLQALHYLNELSFRVLELGVRNLNPYCTQRAQVSRDLRLQSSCSAVRCTLNGHPKPQSPIDLHLDSFDVISHVTVVPTS